MVFFKLFQKFFVNAACKTRIYQSRLKAKPAFYSRRNSLAFLVKIAERDNRDFLALLFNFVNVKRVKSFFVSARFSMSNFISRNQNQNRMGFLSD